MIRFRPGPLARACLLVLFVPAGAAFAQTEGCADPLAELRSVSARYRASQAQVRHIERDAPPAVQAGGEAILRALRSLEAVERDAREQRGQLLALYRVLLERDCEPFDEDGFRTTAARFEAQDRAGLEQIRRLRRRLDSEAQAQP